MNIPVFFGNSEKSHTLNFRKVKKLYESEEIYSHAINLLIPWLEKTVILNEVKNPENSGLKEIFWILRCAHSEPLRLFYCLTVYITNIIQVIYQPSG